MTLAASIPEIWKLGTPHLHPTWSLTYHKGGFKWFSTAWNIMTKIYTVGLTYCFPNSTWERGHWFQWAPCKNNVMWWEHIQDFALGGALDSCILRTLSSEGFTIQIVLSIRCTIVLFQYCDIGKRLRYDPNDIVLTLYEENVSLNTFWSHTKYHTWKYQILRLSKSLN